MITGALMSLACLALIALEKKLGLDHDPNTRLVLLSIVVGGGLIGGQGALKFQPPSEEPKP